MRAHEAADDGTRDAADRRADRTPDNGAADRAGRRPGRHAAARLSETGSGSQERNNRARQKKLA